MIRYITLKIQQCSLLQVSLVCLFWLASELIVHFFKLPFSGGIFGLGVVLLLLATKRLTLNLIKHGAELILADMLLFFIPAVLALLEHHEFIGILGLKILFVILLSTLCVMLVTATVVDYCYHWRTDRAKSHSI
ncbi:CidA/LrgA family protein [Fluoribacter gormanii]|uniref:Holin-like protein n=1 Tax=Fluoribacter gormanii TaxID=464 RepID=A0A377GHF3_9GAMM|nr:CidA/LrgA family protein [Fluoribacter gormanii]KTD02909.1 holin-like protein [Fluoribacter gormanii]MCW8444501.1 CidA/LrgA family protein [Fluoribacter gormanii]MCW8469694.1 CidA/LrgA family protein [Fluoribacter gormanii]SIR92229.1 holin-like protein [Fluoribacter gormanii]STO23975.1 holin-like protein [Fluoribacter gormanii]